MVEAVGAVGEWFSGSASVLAFVAFLFEFVRGRGETRSFRPLFGWLTAALGAVAMITSVVALRERGVRLWEADGRVLAGFLLIGLILIVVGSLTALFTPSSDLSVLREIADAVDRAIHREQEPSDFVASNYVPLRIERVTEVTWYGRSRPSSSRLRSTRMPTASVSVVAGPAGSGKTVALWQFASDICRTVRSDRRPRELVVHVRVRISDVDGPIDEDLIRSHLARSVSRGNTALAAKLESYLAVVNGPRWVFVFDLNAELTREQEIEYFEALRNFMRHRDRDRAVIAVRDGFFGAHPVFVVCPPDRNQVRELLAKQGMALPDARFPPELLRTPDLLMKFGAHLDAGEEAVESFIGSRIDRQSDPGPLDEPSREQAEYVAYHLLMGSPVDDVAALLTVRLGRIERGAFAFRFSVVGTHLAASHMLRHRLDSMILDMVRTEAAREVLLAVLTRADDAYAARVMERVTDLVRMQCDVPTTSNELPPLGSFHWSPEVLHALRVVCDADRARPRLLIPSELRELADRLVWQAVFGGGQHEREAAAALVSLCTATQVLELYRQAITLRYDRRTTSYIAMQLGDELTYVERVVMLSRAVGACADGPVYMLPSSDQGRGLLPRVLEGVVTTAMPTSLGLAIVLAAYATNAADIPFRLMLYGSGALLALLAWRLRAGIASLGRFEARGLRVLTYVGGFVCGPAALSLTLAVVTFSGNLLQNITLLWVFSWPLAMIAAVIHDPFGKRPWIFPQGVLRAIPHYREQWSHHADAVLDRLRGLRSTPKVILLIIMGAVLAILPVDLPIRGDIEQNIDYPALIIVVIVGFGLMKQPVHKLASEDVIAASIVAGEMTEERLFAEIRERAGRSPSELLALLQVLEAAPPGALRSCVSILQSLDTLLEFVERTLPAPIKGSAGAVKPDLWRYAPQTSPRELLDWAIEHDRSQGGSVVRLAHSPRHRALLSAAISYAMTEVG
ncbi:NACHT domain-containing protein [Saccharothrix hoggarensis]|uniref:NACHT domain-containing protein n=1 Tax=Saccharothrix hoggarensis TaxID=913853 RepID=A0ABW3QN61_9PSEU